MHCRPLEALVTTKSTLFQHFYLRTFGPHGHTKCYGQNSRLSQIKGGTNGLSVTGDITVNGEPMSRSFFLENAAYVPQEDRLWSALTGVKITTTTMPFYTHKLFLHYKIIHQEPEEWS